MQILKSDLLGVNCKCCRSRYLELGGSKDMPCLLCEGNDCLQGLWGVSSELVLCALCTLPGTREVI